MLQNLSYAKLFVSRNFSLPKDWNLEENNTCSCLTLKAVKKKSSFKQVSVCNLMYVTNTPYFIPRLTHPFSQLKTKGEISLLALYLESIEASEQRKVTAFHCSKSLSW